KGEEIGWISQMCKHLDCLGNLQNVRNRSHQHERSHQTCDDPVETHGMFHGVCALVAGTSIDSFTNRGTSSAMSRMSVHSSGCRSLREERIDARAKCRSSGGSTCHLALLASVYADLSALRRPVGPSRAECDARN